MSFLNRTDAGRQLANVLGHRGQREVVVMGITRGGVPVAAELAREIGAPLDICVVRKLCTPSGIGFGCIAEAGGLFIDWTRVERLSIPFEDIEAAVQRQTAELARLSTLYRDRAPLRVAGKHVILVDDGLTSTDAARAAVHSLRRRDAGFIELAVPVADAQALADVKPQVDHTVALESASPLASIGARYSELMPVSEAELVVHTAPVAPTR